MHSHLLDLGLQESMKARSLLRKKCMKCIRWWRFFEQADNYNPGQVEYDRSQVTEFYTNEGYVRRGTFGSYSEHPLSVFMGKSLRLATTASSNA